MSGPLSGRTEPDPDDGFCPCLQLSPPCAPAFGRVSFGCRPSTGEATLQKQDGETYSGQEPILASGNSARDVVTDTRRFPLTQIQARPLEPEARQVQPAGVHEEKDQRHPPPRIITSCPAAQLEGQTSHKGSGPRVPPSAAGWREKQAERRETSRSPGCVSPAPRASHLATGESCCIDGRNAHTAAVESLSSKTHQRLSALPHARAWLSVLICC